MRKSSGAHGFEKADLETAGDFSVDSRSGKTVRSSIMDSLPLVIILKDAEFKYLIEAAKSEDCAAMIIVARAFNTGVGLPPSREKNWVKAVYWLEKAVSAKSEDEGDFNSPVDDPSYHLVAEEATMYLNGGYGLAKDAKKAGELFNWAAELATGAKKDSLASEYYMQAKEAWQCVNQRGKKKRN